MLRYPDFGGWLEALDALFGFRESSTSQNHEQLYIPSKTAEEGFRMSHAVLALWPIRTGRTLPLGKQLLGRRSFHEGTRVPSAGE